MLGFLLDDAHDIAGYRCAGKMELIGNFNFQHGNRDREWLGGR